jgi:hypothetical protein
VTGRMKRTCSKPSFSSRINWRKSQSGLFSVSALTVISAGSFGLEAGIRTGKDGVEFRPPVVNDIHPAFTGWSCHIFYSGKSQVNIGIDDFFAADAGRSFCHAPGVDDLTESKKTGHRG